MPLETYVPISQVSEELDISINLLTSFSENGTIKSVRANETIMVEEKEIKGMKKGVALRNEIWAKARRFEKESVGVDDAVHVYGISTTTIYRCIDRKYIRVVGGKASGGRGKKRLLNKADVVYVSELTKRIGGRGRSLFNDPGNIPPHAAR